MKHLASGGPTLSPAKAYFPGLPMHWLLTRHGSYALTHELSNQLAAVGRLWGVLPTPSLAMVWYNFSTGSSLFPQVHASLCAEEGRQPWGSFCFSPSEHHYNLCQNENLSYIYTPCDHGLWEQFRHVQKTSHYLALNPEAQNVAPLLSKVTCQLVLS